VRLQVFLVLFFFLHEIYELHSALACLDIFPNIDRIKHVSCPTLVIHGMKDEEVNVAHGRALYEALKDDCKREPWWVPDRGHNDIMDGGSHLEEYLRRVKRFLASIDD